MGFDGPSLENLQRDQLLVGAFGAHLVKVYYGDALPDPFDAYLKSGGHALSQWVMENMIKHIGFQEEKEWRIVVADPPMSLMSFHAAQASIKASVEIRNHYDDKKLPLKEVMFGPTLRQDTGAVIRWMLEKYGYPDIEVKPSSIPYRL